MLKVYEDEDVIANLTVNDALNVMEDVFRLKCDGTLASPPRFYAESKNGNLVFTAGGNSREDLMGFRVYSTFGKDRDQLVVVFDPASGRVKGVLQGNSIGTYRTGAIGGLSVKYMSRADSRTLGIIGSGKHALMQARVALSVRNFEKVTVYSRTHENLVGFAEKLSGYTETEIEIAKDYHEVAVGSDVLILATSSPDPLIKSDWIRKGTHIITMGKKGSREHEMDPLVAEAASVMATDSVQQFESYGEDQFLQGLSGLVPLTGLSDIICGKAKGRVSEDDITLFLSVGLSGTETLLGNYVIDKLSGKGAQ